MAPRAKTNRERILEEQALLPKIEEMLAPREIEVRADGSEYLGGRQLAPKPEVTRFAGGIGIEQNDDGQWVQRPNYPAAGSGPWGGVLGQRHRVIQRLIDPNNKAFRGDNEIIDPGDLVVNPARLLNVFDGTHRDVAKAAALGITIDELRSAQKVANVKKVRDSRFVRRDSLGNVIDDPSSQITVGEMLEANPIYLQTGEGDTIYRDVNGNLTPATLGVQQGHTTWGLNKIINDNLNQRQALKNHPVIRRNERNAIEANVLPGLDTNIQNAERAKRELALTRGTLADTLDNQRRLELKLDKAEIQRKIEAIEQEKRLYNQQLGLVKAGNEAATARAQKQYDYLSEVMEYEEAERIRREEKEDKQNLKEDKQNLWRTIEELSEKIIPLGLGIFNQ